MSENRKKENKVSVPFNKASVRLEKFSQAELDLYCIKAIRQYAEAVGKAKDMNAEEALKFSELSFDKILPTRSVDTPDQYLFKIMDGDMRIGILNFKINRDKEKPYAFLWDIEIDSQHRGKGYGELSMLALEEKAKELGLTSIWLNVFGYNAPAINLYKKLGYKESAITMIKQL